MRATPLGRGGLKPRRRPPLEEIWCWARLLLRYVPLHSSSRPSPILAPPPIPIFACPHPCVQRNDVPVECRWGNRRAPARPSMLRRGAIRRRPRRDRPRACACASARLSNNRRVCNPPSPPTLAAMPRHVASGGDTLDGALCRLRRGAWRGLRPDRASGPTWPLRCAWHPHCGRRTKSAPGPPTVAAPRACSR